MSIFEIDIPKNFATHLKVCMTKVYLEITLRIDGMDRFGATAI